MADSNEQFSRTCIFCGKKPSNKNNEHAIPKWLIEFTGDPKRVWHLGVRYGEEGDKRERKFAADQFQFPSCEACNDRYSSLEGRSKSNISNLIEGNPLTAAEWDDLLDWFDKVRVGLWLGMKMLSRELGVPDAKFHIDQRIGRKDRCVLVYRINSNHRGCIIHAGGDPPFLFWPSCIGLTINGLVFINISTEYLLAGRMGFPFPKAMVDVGPLTKGSSLRCLYRQKVPFIRFGFYRPVIDVYQSILLADDMVAGDQADYVKLQDHDFIRAHLIAGSATKSLIHSECEGRPIALQPTDQIIERELPQKAYRHGYEYVRQLFEFRHHMLKDYLDSGRGAQAEKLVKTLMQYTGFAIDRIETDLAASGLGIRVKR